MSALEEVCEWAKSIDLAYAWITSSKGKAQHWGALPLEKVRRAVIGRHFAQTEPHALRALWRLRADEREVLRVRPDVCGVYHPKLLIATKGKSVRAIVGSSNFTVGGFGANTELNVLVEGRATDAPIVDLVAFMNREWEHPSRVTLNAAWFEQYQKDYESRPDPPRLSSPDDAEVTRPEQLDVGWADYCRLIANQEPRVRVFGEHSYLQEAEMCRQAFEMEDSYARMSLEDRKLVAGWGNRTSGYFGFFGGAGRFMRVTKDSPALLGEYLDQVPLSGKVDLATAERFLDGVLDIDGVGLGAATRLLAVRRPDQFLAVNAGNYSNIRRVFLIKPDSVEKYLKLIDRLWSKPWHRAPMPVNEDERAVWRARVALVDAFFYEHPN